MGELKTQQPTAYHVYRDEHKIKDKRVAIFYLLVIAVISLLIILTGCSPQKKLNRLLKQHPELQQTTTIVQVRHDTVYTKEIHKDTVFHNIFSRDTIFLRENHLTIKYLYKGGDSAFLGGVVSRDTLIKVDTVREIQKIIEKQVDKPKSGFDIFADWAVCIAIVLLVIFIVLRIYKIDL
jgi:hypothetical protein